MTLPARAWASLLSLGFQRYAAQVQAGEAPWNTINTSSVSDADVAATKLPPGFVDKLTGAPVVLLVFVDLSVVASFDSGLDRIGVISGGSIYPFA